VAASLLAAAVLPHDSKTFWTDALWHSERLRANDGTSNQSLRGMWLRAVHDGHMSTALWLVSAAIVAVIGFRRVRTAERRGDALTAAALTGLLAVLLSPVSWIHHLCWLLLVLAAIVGDGRDARRVVSAAAVYAFFVVKVPWIGAHWLHSGGPTAPARLVEDGYGLGVLVLLITLRARSVTQSSRTVAESVTVRHNRSSTVTGGAA
jgi:alpha-1,2-mannosyltransferase